MGYRPWGHKKPDIAERLSTASTSGDSWKIGSLYVWSEPLIPQREAGSLVLPPDYKALYRQWGF